MDYLVNAETVNSATLTLRNAVATGIYGDCGSNSKSAAHGGRNASG
jgi:hypothetical protein